MNQQTLKEIMHYDPETGAFTWLAPARYGKAAGCIETNGYVVIGHKRKYYKAHRLAFLYMTGDWPPYHMDHINGVRDDNRWINLRPATRQQNNMNAKRRKDNKHMMTGVHWHKSHRKWAAMIGNRGKVQHLGMFSSLLDAAAARLRAERELGFHANHGRAS